MMEHSFILTKNLADIKLNYVGVFPKGHISILVGEPSVGKTWFLLDLCRGVADGMTAIGSWQPYKKGKAIIFAGETGVRLLAERLELMGGMCNLGDLRVFSSQAMMEKSIDVMCNTALGRKHIAEAIEEFKPDIVFFDTLISFTASGADESNIVDMADPIRALTSIANKYDCAIVLVHHFRKSKKSERDTMKDMNDVIGSSALIRLASLVVGIERKGEIRVCRCLKSWWKEFRPFAFTIKEQEGCVRLCCDYDVDESGGKSYVSATNRVEQHIKETYRGVEFSISDVVRSSGISRNTVATAMQGLFNQGVIFHSRKDRHTQYYTTERPLIESI